MPTPSDPYKALLCMNEERHAEFAAIRAKRHTTSADLHESEILQWFLAWVRECLDNIRRAGGIVPCVVRVSPIEARDVMLPPEAWDRLAPFAWDITLQPVKGGYELAAIKPRLHPLHPANVSGHFGDYLGS